MLQFFSWLKNKTKEQPKIQISSRIADNFEIFFEVDFPIPRDVQEAKFIGNHLLSLLTASYKPTTLSYICKMLVKKSMQIEDEVIREALVTCVFNFKKDTKKTIDAPFIQPTECFKRWTEEGTN